MRQFLGNVYGHLHYKLSKAMLVDFTRFLEGEGRGGGGVEVGVNGPGYFISTQVGIFYIGNEAMKMW